MEYTSYKDLSNEKSNLLDTIKYKLYGSTPTINSKKKYNTLITLIIEFKKGLLEKCKGCKSYFTSSGKKNNPL